MSEARDAGGHVARPRLVLAATFVAALLASLPATAQETHYKCNDGATFTATPQRGGAAVLLTLDPGGVRVELDSAAGSVGERYQGGGYMFFDRRHSVILKVPGSKPVDCIAQAPGDVVPPSSPPVTTGGPLPPPVSQGPSFSCAANLGPAESEICAVPALGDLDRQMADTYGWLTTQLSTGNQQALRNDQRAWLSTRNNCGRSFSCLQSAYLDRIAYLNEYLEPGAPPGAAFPIAAKSWGGIVRSGPGMEYQRVTGLAEGAPITLLSDTGVAMNGYNWFEISWGNRTGYQWGGIICGIGTPIDGAFEVCN